jgi:hypothetical protein
LVDALPGHVEFELIVGDGDEDSEADEEAQENDDGHDQVRHIMALFRGRPDCFSIA